MPPNPLRHPAFAPVLLRLWDTDPGLTPGARWALRLCFLTDDGTDTDPDPEGRWPTHSEVADADWDLAAHWLGQHQDGDIVIAPLPQPKRWRSLL